jgi:hypothetical protein
MAKARRQRKCDLECMARGKLFVVIAPQRHAHLDLLFRNFDLGSQNDPWLPRRARSRPLGAPLRGASEPGSIRRGLILLVEHGVSVSCSVVGMAETSDTDHQRGYRDDIFHGSHPLRRPHKSNTR